MRFNELAAARAAHAAGLSPEIIASGRGYMVSRFIEGRSLSPEEVRSLGYRDQVLDLIRRCHMEIPKVFRGPALIFWVFQVNRGYIGLLKGDRSRLVGALPRLESIGAALERAVGPVEIVFGHNDLLPGNLFDDGTRLWLLDWDYAGFNTPLFDLANLSSNNGFEPVDDEWLLNTYYGADLSAATVKAFHAMKCASLLREALWSAVSESRSTIDFDYVAYTNENLSRFETSLVAFTSQFGEL
ncbi:MAG: phosphotransferase [Chitinophagales bacterium]|nr:phosphotransferase [Hyphomicrobiales bacterium]